MVLLPGIDKKDIIVYFVKCEDFKKTMAKTFFCCTKANIKVWIIPKEEINQVSHHKNIIFVLNKFAGKSFEYLQSKNCQIVGPKCLYTCVTKKLPIPDNNSPVFCLAMLGVVATSTKISKKLKESLSIIIGYMGGIYLEHLSPDVTHLLSNGGITPKLEAAINHQIPIMSPYWITDIWEMSQTKDIFVKDNEECIKYRLPPFKGLIITSSNVIKLEKMKIKALIEAHGGTYTATLQKCKTSILITDDVESKKFKHAQEWGILCLKPSWIYESAANGYAVVIKSHLTSQNPNLSTNSQNLNTSNDKTDIINETENSLNFNIEKESSNMELLSEIEFFQIIPGFLEGCKIYLSGFKEGEIQNIKKIINIGKATLYTIIDKTLTHIIVKNLNEEINNLDDFLKEKAVKFEWLKASIDLKYPAHRQDFSFFNQITSTTLNNEKFSKIDVKNSGIFKGLTFCVFDLNQNQRAVDNIKKYGGEISDENVDYTIVPFIFSTMLEISCYVTALWIEDCIENGEILKVEYYHKPINPPRNDSLRNCVISISKIYGAEKYFLTRLAMILGAKVQSCFAFKNVKNILKTTHLLCHDSTSIKYKAAIKSNIPIISKDWVLFHLKYDRNDQELNESQVEKADVEYYNNMYKENWRKWLEDVPELYRNSKEMQKFRNDRFHIKLKIMLKQLWVKFGGAIVEGIDSKTGELLPDGPFCKLPLPDSPSIPSTGNTPELDFDNVPLQNERFVAESDEDEEILEEPTLKKYKKEDNNESEDKKRIFGFSNISSELRKKYSIIIKSLGGTVINNHDYDPQITHLLTDKLTFNDKIICSIASGKWILHSSYINGCYELRAFIKEENFEWGNIQSQFYIPEIKKNTKESAVAHAAYKWRYNKQIHGVEKFPFLNFKVVFIIDESKISNFKRVIEAGGGTVLEPSYIFEATHIFWDGIVNLPVQKSILTDQKKLILNPIYLINHLLSMCKTDINSHLL